MNPDDPQEEALRRAIAIQEAARAQDEEILHRQQEEDDNQEEQNDEEEYPEDTQESNERDNDDEESSDEERNDSDNVEIIDEIPAGSPLFQLTAKLFLATVGGHFGFNRLPSIEYRGQTWSPTLRGAGVIRRLARTQNGLLQTREGQDREKLIITPSAYSSATTALFIKGVILYPIALSVRVENPLYAKCDTCSVMSASIKCSTCGAIVLDLFKEISKALDVDTLKIFDGNKTIVEWNKP